jgi:hypothetical protein
MRAIEQPWMAIQGLQPTRLSVLLARTTLTRGSVALYPLGTEDLHGYPLVHVLHNSLPSPVPGVEGVGEAPHPLQEGESALWLVSPNSEHKACHLSPGRFRQWLEHLADDSTVCVRDGGYFFGVPIGEPRLKQRRHLVLVQNRTPQQVILELGVLGLDERRSTIKMTLLTSDYDEDAAYLLLRPDAPWPIVIVPTAIGTAREMIEQLQGGTAVIRFSFVGPPEFFSSQEVTTDLFRVITDFEGFPLPPELAGPPPAQSPRAPPPAGGKDIEPLVEDAAAAWNGYERDRNRRTFEPVAVALERVLDSPLLDMAPIERRVEILEDAAGCFYAAFESEQDTDALRRCITIRKRLLATLPDHWPGRNRQLQITGHCLLRLWAVTGEATDQQEALELLHAGGAPGFE